MKILKIRRKHTRGLLKFVFRRPEPGRKLYGTYYTQNTTPVNVFRILHGRSQLFLSLWDIWEKPLFPQPQYRKKRGVSEEKMGSSAFQHTDYRHIFLKKYAGALSVTGRAVKKRTGRERTGEKLFPSEKNTEFSFDFLSVLQGVTFFCRYLWYNFSGSKINRNFSC